ncbi:MAG: hypothetical protein HY869_03185 [Chloroflexi bacterium]|nr:hypothetical protein [Chloroflexota bacterium]
MDPYTEGDKIFRKIAQAFGIDEIDDINLADTFFKMLLAETQGAVIIDFLDAGNWDSFCGYNIDKDKELLYLYWYGCEENNNKLDSQTAVIPLHGLLLRFHSIGILNEETKNPLFLLRGYTMSEKEIRKILSQHGDEYYNFKFNYFSERVLRMVEDANQKFLCLNTPLYSVVILPKSLNTSAQWSKFFLYNVNLSLCKRKLEQIREFLASIHHKDIDLIYEKSSTIRRTLENVLKIESCFREIEYKKSYSQQLLGDLTSALKNYHDEPVKSTFGKMAEWANELSHDTGLPVTKTKAVELCNLVADYTEQVVQLINSDASEDDANI